MSTNIESGVATGFVGWSREQLIETALQMGVKFAAGDQEEDMRAKLLQAVGAPVPAEKRAGKRAAVESSSITSLSGRPLSLRSRPPTGIDKNGTWGGKCRLIRVARDSVHPDQVWDYKGWWGTFRAVADKIQEWPWPAYQALLGQHQDELREREKLNLQTGAMEPERYFINTHPLNYVDIGPDPKTDHLPESLHQWLQWQALDTRYLEGATRRQLIEIMVLLTDGDQGKAQLKDDTDEYIRELVLEKLGLLAQFEEWRETSQRKAA